jgi:nitrile hydratase accessory protein
VRLAPLPRLPLDEGGPVFAEPWQAQAFAIAVTLSDQGHFTWKEWASELADTLRDAADRGEPDDGSRYYEHWLATLERVVLARGLADHARLAARKEAWAAAYRTTPHGTPVELPQSRAKPQAWWIFLALVTSGVASWIVLRTNVGLLASAGFGAVLGLRHALEPDHLAAVSTLMTGERSSAKAAWLGACWGVGHTLTLLAAGALLVFFQADMPAIASDMFELGVRTAASSRSACVPCTSVFPDVLGVRHIRTSDGCQFQTAAGRLHAVRSSSARCMVSPEAVPLRRSSSPRCRPR